MTDLVRMFTGVNVQFAHPWFLLALLAVPVLAWMRGDRGGAPAVEFSSTATAADAGRTAESKSGNFLTGLYFVGLASLIVALARPQGGRRRRSGRRAGSTS